MKVLIAGICGFVGSRLATWLRHARPDWEILGFDNLSRPGSESSRLPLTRLGVRFFHADIRLPSDVDQVPPVDWLIDAAALPSVLAGTSELAGASGSASARQLMEANLFGTVHLLEVCRRHAAGLIMISTSRVYSIDPLSRLPLRSIDGAYVPQFPECSLPGLTPDGIGEQFPTTAPVSLYGATRIAAEAIACEYAAAFGIPVRINRCGVLAGAGQFGRADQGIFAFWIHSFREGALLRYIGFEGQGLQVRDMLHPHDLAELVSRQVEAGDDRTKPVLANVSGGVASAMSLQQLTRWCEDRFGKRTVGVDLQSRPYDLPWVVLDSSRARQAWDWAPQWTRQEILSEIADFADQHPNWTELSR